ncbi:hypothetical protein ES708_33015 [subsurface metagenome]
MIKITITTKSLTDDEQVKLAHMGYKRSNPDNKFFQEFEEVDEAINSVKWIVSDFNALAFDFVMS